MLKLLGAAAHESWNFEECWKLGTEVNAQLATIGTSLDHCHIPGRTHHETIDQDACVLGMGIHNEPVRNIQVIPATVKLTLCKGPAKDLPDAAPARFDQGDAALRSGPE